MQSTILLWQNTGCIDCLVPISIPYMYCFSPLRRNKQEAHLRLLHSQFSPQARAKERALQFLPPWSWVEEAKDNGPNSDAFILATHWDRGGATDLL